jgi:hypothetical protein
MFHRFCHVAALVALGVLASASRPARADIYMLTSGGQVQGELINPTESPRKQYIIRTDEGAKITIDRAQLKQIVPQSAAEIEYEKIKPTYPDTLEGQLQLADWCQKHSLQKQRMAALERVIEIDPNHTQSRALLGYSFLDGKWIRREDWLKENGRVLHKGKWLLPQEVELIENRRAAELAEKSWFVNLRKWLKWLDDPTRSKEADELIHAINDPAAVPAIIKGIKESEDRPLRTVFVQLLGKIYSPLAIKALVQLTMSDRDAEIRTIALEELTAKPHPDITAEFIPYLRNKDNTLVNRAGLALGKFGDKSVVRPLIDALVTTHSFAIVSGNSDPNSISAGFGSDGNGGLSMGSTRKIQKRDLQNQNVLDALVNLTNQNYDFDEVAWRSWHAAQNKAAKANPRRD